MHKCVCSAWASVRVCACNERANVGTRVQRMQWVCARACNACACTRMRSAWATCVHICVQWVSPYTCIVRAQVCAVHVCVQRMRFVCLHMGAYAHTCAYVCVHRSVCLHAQGCMCVCTRTCVHTCPWVRGYACVPTCIFTACMCKGGVVSLCECIGCVFAHMHTCRCLYACVCTCVPAAFVHTPLSHPAPAQLVELDPSVGVGLMQKAQGCSGGGRDGASRTRMWVTMAPGHGWKGQCHRDTHGGTMAPGHTW